MFFFVLEVRGNVIVSNSIMPRRVKSKAIALMQCFCSPAVKLFHNSFKTWDLLFIISEVSELCAFVLRSGVFIKAKQYWSQQWYWSVVQAELLNSSCLARCWTTLFFFVWGLFKLDPCPCHLSRSCLLWHLTVNSQSLTYVWQVFVFLSGSVNPLTNGLRRGSKQKLVAGVTHWLKKALILEAIVRASMADVNTKSMSAHQAESTDIVGREEDRRKKSQTSARTQQCNSVEITNNNSSIQSDKAQSPDTLVTQCPVQGSNVEPSGTVTLKMQTAVLPLCLGESTVFLPVHIQVPTPAPAAQVCPVGATTPLVLPSHGPVSLPLMLEQQIFQQFNSQFLSEGAVCSAPPPLLQSNVLCQNSSVTFCQPSPREQKVLEPATDEQDRLAFAPSPGFTAISQDQFTTSHNSFAHIACQMAGPNPTQAFAQSFLSTPPSLPQSYPYASPLAPLVPPPTLLVPFPIVVPLPVPLPIPLPIPIPIRTKAEAHDPKSTAAVGTQTCDGFFDLSSSLSHSADSEGGALDLSAAAGLTRLKHEVLSPQDSPLDLSVAVAYHGCKPLVQVEQPDIKQPVRDVQRSGQSLEVFQPLAYGQDLDSELLRGLTPKEFSRHRKWLMDNHCSNESKYDARNYEIVSTSQTAKVIVAVKDSVPTVFRGKLKDLNGIPASTFPSKQDTELGALVRHHCSPARNAQGEIGHLTDPRRGIPRNATVKFKKVSSQEIHILPIKKQRFTAFFHGE